MACGKVVSVFVVSVAVVSVAVLRGRGGTNDQRYVCVKGECGARARPAGAHTCVSKYSK